MDNETSKLLWYVPAIMLLLALFPWIYGYYVAVRLVVCVSSAIIAWLSYQKSGLCSWTFVFIFIALIFNPLLPVYLVRSIWIPIDIVVAILFFKHQKIYLSH